MLTQKMEIYWAVKEMAKDLGFADSGCAAASEVSASVKDAYLYAKEAGFFAGMEYLHNNMEKRFINFFSDFICCLHINYCLLSS